MGKRAFLPSWTMIWLALLLFMALAAPVISGRLPLLAFDHKEVFFPAFFPKKSIHGKVPSEIDWNKSPWRCVYPLFPHDPDLRTSGTRPYEPPSVDHPFGTDQSGRDVMVRLVYGTRQTLLFSGVGLVVAITIGLMLGAWAGSSPTGINIKWTVVPFMALGVIMTCTLEDWAPSYFWWIWPILGCALGQVIPKVKRFHLQPDHWLTPLAALLTAFPRLIFLLVFSSWFSPGIHSLAVLIGGLSWAGTYRVVRSITQTWQSSGEKNALDALGIPRVRQWYQYLWRHLWPVLLPGMATAAGSFILLEATLGFLQIPLPNAHYGWGSLLAQAKRNPDAWWLFVFPGLFLILTLWVMYRWKKVESIHSL